MHRGRGCPQGGGALGGPRDPCRAPSRSRIIPPGADAASWVLGLRNDAETVLGAGGPAPAATVEESERLLRWLESEGVRLVHLDGEWTCPVGSALKHREEPIAGFRRDSVPT